MATAQVFHLPDLGEGLTEAAIVSWLVAVGDEIAVDQPIAEVETAKSIVELPSPYGGRVTELHGTVGDVVQVGAPILHVAAASDDHGGHAPEEVELAAHRQEERAGSGNVLIGYGTPGGSGGTRRRRSPASSAGTVSGTTGAVTVSAPIAPATVQAATAGASQPTYAVAVRSPLVRRLARELGVDVRAVDGSGEGGVITRADVLAAAERPATLEAQAPVAPRTAVLPDGLEVVTREPFSPLRRAVSATLSASRSEIPEATVWVDVDATALWDLRPLMAADGGRAPSLTALLARFVLLALAEYPLLASRLGADGDEIITFDGVNLGVATDTERGLMVPSLRHADRLSISELDAALREVAERARSGRIPPADLRGSTFTLNNYGSLGVDGSAAIINHPEVAILGIGRMIERAWVVDGAIVPRRIVQLSLVFDHRVCDGGYASGFLRHLVASIENPLLRFPQL